MESSEPLKDTSEGDASPPTNGAYLKTYFTLSVYQSMSASKCQPFTTEKAVK